MPYQDKIQRHDKPRSGTALGGIGAGWFELRKDGIFRNWNIFNNQPFGTGPFLGYQESSEWRAPWRAFEEDSMLFFIVRYQEEGRQPRMKILQVDEGYEVGAIPSHYYTFPWMSGVDEISYEAAYPFARLKFSGRDMPLEVELEAWHAFIPHDVKNSALPAVHFDFKIKSKSRRPADVMLMASLRNAAGYETRDKHYVTKTVKDRGCRIIGMSCGGMDRKASSWGTLALASLSGNSTYYTGWEHRHPYYETVIRSRALPNTDDTAGRNIKDKKTGKLRAMDRLFSSAAVSKKMNQKGAVLEHGFLLSWHFPNLYARESGLFEGHYYDNHFKSAADAARYAIRHKKALREKSRQFQKNFRDSSLPEFVLDQVNSHLNTFSTSAWLTKAGNFGVQEGMTPEQQYGPLATIDVGMYGSLSAAALFPELDQSMMRAHKRLQNKNGSICHGIQRDFVKNLEREAVGHRLDLPSQYVIMALRGAFWTDDRAYLEEMWPSVQRAIEYVLRERDANGDGLPDMGGSMCTYDNFPMYGAASYVASLWLSALAYAREAARMLKDEKAAERYGNLLDHGRKVFDEKLWNGRCYRLYNDIGGPRGDLDEGCLTDQIIGEWANHHAGLPPLFPKGKKNKALKTIMRMAYQPEYGLVNCRWPDDDFLRDVDENCWSDQANTCWTGVELAFASFLICEGYVDEGLKVIKNVDDRYRKSGMYFDHQEFGGHYYRPMSAWAILNAMLGLAIKGKCYTFDPRWAANPLRLFFSFGQGTAHFDRRRSAGKETCAVAVNSGTFRFKELRLRPARPAKSVKATVAGRPISAKGFHWEMDGEFLTVVFRSLRTVRQGGKALLSITLDK